MIAVIVSWLISCAEVRAWVIDCQIMPRGQDLTGLRYTAIVVEQELSETHWLLLFAGSGFTGAGEYRPHFIDLMIKASWAATYRDGLCADGWPAIDKVTDQTSVEIGLSDYEDVPGLGGSQDNDIAMWCRSPEMMPRRFTNIDSRSVDAPDKIMAEYQVDVGGPLEGRPFTISLVRGEETRLLEDRNYFIDPDQNCVRVRPDDILYRHWTVTMMVPENHVETVVDLYVNAEEGAGIWQYNALNFMWENPGRPSVETDKFKVIIYDTAFRDAAGLWHRADKFLVDWRTLDEELVVDEAGRSLGGFRKTRYRGQPAIEASFGYGHSDYVVDSTPCCGEPWDGRGVLDLETLPADLETQDMLATRWADMKSTTR